MKPGQNRVVLLAWVLCGLVAVAFGFIGAVEPSVRFGLAIGVLPILAVAGTLPERSLGKASVGLNGVVAVALLLGMGMTLGLLPMPGRPGWRAAEDGMAALSVLALVAGFAGAAAVWGAQQRDAKRLEDVVLVAVIGFALLSLVHGATGVRRAFGLVATTNTLPGTYFGPLVNPNHVGSVLLLGLPLAVDRVARHGWKARLGLVVVLVAPIAMAIVGARAALLVGAGISAGVLVWRGHARWVVLAAIPAVAVVLLRPTSAGPVDSVGGRLQIWGDTLRMGLDHPLLGVGAGGYGEAFEAYRTDHWRNSIAHAHSDPLEWLVENGLVGAAFGVGAVVLGLRGLRAPGSIPLLLGVGGVAAHALVDFPLSIPAIAMACAGVLAALAGMQGRKLKGDPSRARVLLAMLALANVFGAAAAAHRARVDAAVADLREAGARSEQAAATLRDWAYWRGWDQLHAAWVAERAGDRAGAARHAREVVGFAPHDDDRLRPAALVLARVGADDAVDVARQAVEQGPADYRNHVALARVHRMRGEAVEAAEAYARAFEDDAPYSIVPEALEAFPLGLYWVDRLEELPRYQMELASRMIYRGQAHEALLIYDRAAAVDPETWGDVPARSLALMVAGYPEEARSSAEARADSAPDDPQTWYVLGNVRFEQGDPEGAVEAWRVVQDQLPGVQVSIVRALARIDRAQAVDEFERLRLTGVDATAARLELARAHRSAGDQVACEALANGARDAVRDRVRAICADGN